MATLHSLYPISPALALDWAHTNHMIHNGCNFSILCTLHFISAFPNICLLGRSPKFWFWLGHGVLTVYLVFKYIFVQAVLKWVGQVKMRVRVEINSKVNISNKLKSKPRTLSNHLSKAFIPVNKYTDHTLPLTAPYQLILLLYTVLLSHRILSHEGQIKPHNPFQHGALSSRNCLICQHMKHYLYVTLALGRKGETGYEAVKW